MNKLPAYLHISALTTAELLRTPICLLVAASSVVFVYLLPLVLSHTFGEPGKMVRDSSLALVFLGSLILAAVAAASALQREVQSGTTGSVLSKPVSRAGFLLSKFAGVAQVLLAYVLICLLAILVAGGFRYHVYAFDLPRIGIGFLVLPVSFLFGAFRNFRVGTSFCAASLKALPVCLLIAVAVCGFRVDGAWVGHGDWGSTLSLNLLPVGSLLAIAALMLQGFALLVATRLPLAPSLLCCFAIFLLGLLSDAFFATGQGGWLASLLYALIPNWQHFWLADALEGGNQLPWSYVAHTATYASTWLAGILCLAVASFQKMEIR